MFALLVDILTNRFQEGEKDTSLGGYERDMFYA
jgi:hypothetical protein